MSELREETNEIRRDEFDIAPGVMTGELVCGYIDPFGNLHKTFVINEMGGREEGMLTAEGDPHVRLNQMIFGCLVQLGSIVDRGQLATAVNKLVSSDRFQLVVAMRRASVGDLYHMAVHCSCGKQTKSFVNLKTDLEFKPMENPMVRNYEVFLPRMKQTAKWHVLTSEDEGWLSAKADKIKKEDRLDYAIMARLDEVGDVKIMRDSRASLEFVKDMRKTDRDAFRSEFKRVEAGNDDEIIIKCKCGRDVVADLDIQQRSFFFHSGT